MKCFYGDCINWLPAGLSYSTCRGFEFSWMYHEFYAKEYLTMSLWLYIRQGGIALYPLCLCSLLLVTVIVERVRAFQRIGNIPAELFKQVKRVLNYSNNTEAIRMLSSSHSPYSRIARASLEQNDTNTDDVLTMACEEEVEGATRGLWILGTIGNIAPFIGLLGTVLGIMQAFHDVGIKGTTNSVVISQGISEALITTFLGLAIGICAVVANNWCATWVEKYRRQLNHFSTKWSSQLIGPWSKPRTFPMRRANRWSPWHDSSKYSPTA